MTIKRRRVIRYHSIDNAVKSSLSRGKVFWSRAARALAKLGPGKKPIPVTKEAIGLRRLVLQRRLKTVACGTPVPAFLPGVWDSTASVTQDNSSCELRSAALRA
jgi:hypothetical protein